MKNKKAEQETEKTAKKPVREKKLKSEEYVLKKNSGLRALRIVLWVMIGFVFLRGVTTILSPDKSEEVERMIREFKATLAQEKELNNEAMAFAQNFAREYLTYTVKGEEDFKKRIEPYVSKNVYNQAGLMDFKDNAEAFYVEAYRLEEYAPGQLDVYVLADVNYSSQVMAEDQAAFTVRQERGQTVLKVPLYVEKGFYVVESLPMFVSDTDAIENYSVKDYVGTALKEEQTKEVRTAVENFLKAYYEQDATVIDYYLSAGADKGDFAGLDGRYAFGKIEMVNAYQEPGQDIICIVEYNIKDGVNGAVIAQKIHLSVKKDGSRYYIDAIDTRTGNI